MAAADTQPVVLVGGPTASGKSGFALALAERLNGVVINCDSMQMYDGLPLLTAQPSAEEKSRAPHALYGTLHPHDTCSAARWRTLALATLEHARAEGRLPIIAGGTGFYLHALLKGLSPVPETLPGVREALIAKQKALGQKAFFAAFAALDPAMAGKLDPHNTQRVIRAWEVLESTGKSLAHWQSVPPEGAPEHLAFTTFVLLPPTELLYAQCNTRFEHMMRDGAMEEAQAFRLRFPEPSLSLHHALGYRELCDCMDGLISCDEAVDKAKQSTRNYAKRQQTWFRRQLTADKTVHAPEAELEAAIELLKAKNRL